LFSVLLGYQVLPKSPLLYIAPCGYVDAATRYLPVLSLATLYQLSAGAEDGYQCSPVSLDV
jgi:hypothetical protein